MFGRVDEAFDSNGRAVDISLRLLSGAVLVVADSLIKGATLRRSFIWRGGAYCDDIASARESPRGEGGGL